MSIGAYQIFLFLKASIYSYAGSQQAKDQVPEYDLFKKASSVKYPDDCEYESTDDKCYRKMYY